ncbi:hypothetical protein GWK47_039274 [Chionoecetes opilio]|uniref:Uncharacterized protein n=1 Tax=Chionoecetes opilio TaxID=41210 RepID=A0A8J4YK91_CHIOP|nr:hypothetical protein GWK47_039274 [Chionoecetes opilio]
MHVPPSLQQLKAQARRAAAHCAHQTHRELEARKRQAAWYAAATDYHPLETHPATTQGRWRTTAACASGLLHQRGSYRRTSRGKCATTARCTPVAHGALPPVLPRHRPPEARPAPAAQPAGGGC